MSVAGHSTYAYCTKCERPVSTGALFFGEGDGAPSLAFCDCVSVDVGGCDKAMFFNRAPEYWEERIPDLP